MVVTIQFKDRNKVFRGNTYDYILNKEENVPKTNSIIRIIK